jgi:hypothetical protein
MSRARRPKKEVVEILLPEETRLFNIYKKVKEAVEHLEKEFGREYEVSDITVGVSITASISPSFTGSVSATLTKKKP